jgi:hypothetical protein
MDTQYFREKKNLRLNRPWFQSILSDLELFTHIALLSLLVKINLTVNVKLSVERIKWDQCWTLHPSSIFNMSSK